MLDKGVKAIDIAKNCGTSVTMIENFYTANVALENMLSQWLATGRKDIKRVS